MQEKSEELVINKKTVKKILIIISIFLAATFIFNLVKKPSEYDCLKLGSDDARYACLDKYHPLSDEEADTIGKPFPIKYVSINEHYLDCSIGFSCILNFSITNNYISDLPDYLTDLHGFKIRVEVLDEKNNKLINTEEITFTTLMESNSTEKFTHVLKKLDMKSKYKVILNVISAN